MGLVGAIYGGGPLYDLNQRVGFENVIMILMGLGVVGSAHLFHSATSADRRKRNRCHAKRRCSLKEQNGFCDLFFGGPFGYLFHAAIGAVVGYFSHVEIDMNALATEALVLGIAVIPAGLALSAFGFFIIAIRQRRSC